MKPIQDTTAFLVGDKVEFKGGLECGKSGVFTINQVYYTPLLGLSVKLSEEEFRGQTFSINNFEPYKTPPMRCTKCGRVTNELHTNLVYPEQGLCPECWRATQPKTTFSRTESNEEIAYKKLKKWLKKKMEKCKKEDEWYEVDFIACVLEKIGKLEGEK